MTETDAALLPGLPGEGPARERFPWRSPGTVSPA